MGSDIRLALGNLEVDWGKNHTFINHLPLFQPGDSGDGDYVHHNYDETEEVEKGKVLSKLLKEVIQRLAMLGYSLASVKREYEELRNQFERGKDLEFGEFMGLIKRVDVARASDKYSDDHDLGEFFQEEMIPRLKLKRYFSRPGEEHSFSVMMENFHPWSVLCMLAENPANIDLPVVWYFADIVTGGYEEAASFYPDLQPIHRFLLVTEGSSDAKTLRKALDLLRPSISDFFYFVDMEDGYPFSGTGNLANFCKGLLSIRVINKILVIFDNDAEGVFKAREIAALARPKNMAIMVLPDLAQLEGIETIGPSGKSLENVNGRAASVEAYLDLTWGNVAPALVRWTSYLENTQCYQGALVGKENYARRILDLRCKERNYDFSKLEIVVERITEACTKIASAGADSLRMM
jgi:hypothetical protein